MKLIYPIFFILFLKSAVLFTQSPLETKLDYKVEDQTVENALYELISSSKVSIIISNNLLPKNIKVSLDVKEATVKNILESILKETKLTYQIVGNQIVIVKQPEPVIKRKYTLSGFIENKETGEKIVNAGIYDSKTQIGALSNEYGFFSLTLPEGEVELVCSYLGYQTFTTTILHSQNQKLNISLNHTFLKEIVITAKNDSVFVESPSLNSDYLMMDNVNKLPSLGGESDVVRLTHLLPGIQTGADGVGGISVRGGNVDQNLFLLDGVPVYNPHHAIGIYSIYNSSAIRSAELIRGPFPAKYGGRISSVMDVRTKEGNMKESSVDLDMGLTSMKLKLEGPIKTDKTSYFISGRQSLFHLYSIPLTRRIREDNGIDGFISYSFFDLNLKLNHKISESDHFYISYYRGSDNFTDENTFQRTASPDFLFDIDDFETISWGNEIGSFRWNHVFNPKLFANITLTYSRYFYEASNLVAIRTSQDSIFLNARTGDFENESRNRDLAGSIEFDYALNENHLLEFGLNATYHRFKLSTSLEEKTVFELKTTEFLLGDSVPYILKSYEFDAFIQDQWKISDQWNANIGLRISAMGWTDKTYLLPQPRLSLNYYPSDKAQFQLALGKTVQHLHLLSPSNNISGLPKDLWVNSTSLIRPQESWQFMIGFQQKFKNGVEFNFSHYYKKLDNLISFKESSLLLFNSDDWQNRVELGQGWTYGTELMLKKQTPRFSGWLSYTLAKSTRQFDGTINNGKKFPFRLDRRHNLNLTFLYKFSSNIEFAANWVYASGSLFTAPEAIAWFIAPSSPESPHESILSFEIGESKNNRSFRDYHRLDLAVNFLFQFRKIHYTIKLGVYNAYVRLNPIYADFNERYTPTEGFGIDAKQVSLLPIFPSLRFHLKFL